MNKPPMKVWNQGYTPSVHANSQLTIDKIIVMGAMLGIKVDQRKGFTVLRNPVATKDFLGADIVIDVKAKNYVSFYWALKKRLVMIEPLIKYALELGAIARCDAGNTNIREMLFPIRRNSEGLQWERPDKTLIKPTDGGCDETE